jgi:hypothetical protein
MSERKSGQYWVLFLDTGQKFQVRYMQTSDQYEVELPCGLYVGEYIRDLRGELSAEFQNVRITTK